MGYDRFVYSLLKKKNWVTMGLYAVFVCPKKKKKKEGIRTT